LRLSERHQLLTEAELNTRRGPKGECSCQISDSRRFVVRNDSNNCFASVLLLALMGADSYPTVTAPDAGEVAEHAGPFFDLVSTLNFVNDQGWQGKLGLEFKHDTKVCVQRGGVRSER